MLLYFHYCLWLVKTGFICASFQPQAQKAKIKKKKKKKIYCKIIFYIFPKMDFQLLACNINNFLYLSKKILKPQSGWWLSVKFLIPSYTLGWLLINHRIENGIIRDDCWFSLPCELSSPVQILLSCPDTFIQ